MHNHIGVHLILFPICNGWQVGKTKICGLVLFYYSRVHLNLVKKNVISFSFFETLQLHTLSKYSILHSVFLSLKIFILQQLRNNFLQLIENEV